VLQPFHSLGYVSPLQHNPTRLKANHAAKSKQDHGCLIVSLDLGRLFRPAVHAVRAGLAIVNCPDTFHSIELCAFPESLAVLLGKPLAVHFVTDMRNGYLLVVAGNGWANEVLVNQRIVANRARAQYDGK
jgi:hypothetical protein